MIYTSYFAKIRKFPENIKPVSIALWPPKNYQGDKLPALAPPKNLLTWYKYAEGTEEIKNAEYTRIYNAFLTKNVTLDWFKNQIVTIQPETKDGKPIYESQTDHIALCCYEKSDDFCHRNLLAEYLSKQGLPIKELIL